MIPLDYIVEWRKTAPWVENLQVEQDLVMARALVEIFSRPEVAGMFAFRGGTALYKIHLPKPARYSEDIDLVQTKEGSYWPAIDAIREVLDPWLGTPRVAPSERSIRLIYRMKSEDSSPRPMRLKVEVNCTELFAIYGYKMCPYRVKSSWYEGSTTIRSYELDELLGTKLRALYQRKKGRDLFDLYFASRNAQVDPDRVIHCFLGYVQRSKNKISRAQFEANLEPKFSDPDFMGDMTPLLATGTSWEPAKAAQYVLEELLPRLPGKPWKSKGESKA